MMFADVINVLGLVGLFCLYHKALEPEGLLAPIGDFISVLQEQEDMTRLELFFSKALGGCEICSGIWLFFIPGYFILYDFSVYNFLILLGLFVVILKMIFR